MIVIPISSPSQMYAEQKLFLCHSSPKTPKRTRKFERIKIDDQNCRSTRENFMSINLLKMKMEKRTYEMALCVIKLLS